MPVHVMEIMVYHSNHLFIYKLVSMLLFFFLFVLYMFWALDYSI